ncbi:hypothetical protein DSO57_1034137 [Entomophthora muscae]|uniref:Uncharacterized protein n=2 Tax=Entomophthora muscae TaxID=34485 RepID=A0ACC2SZW1_9FUNG|nr:hypothetical protein DSO57_1034134 [Entomophthora muscae]KAJ9067915.1 hypothetical protein DSO57_1034137 [Entomophthora muscae]
MRCPHTPSVTNVAHYREPMYLPVEEDSVSPPSLLTGFHELYDGAPMGTSDIKRDCWFCQEEEIIDVNNLPIIPDSKCAELSIASLD